MLLVWLAGCADFELDLTEEWKLDRLRLLAIQADPAEPRPGETVRLTSLAHVPPGAEASSVWFACLRGARRGCVQDEELLGTDPRELTDEGLARWLEALEEEGLIGYEPGAPPEWFVPWNALANTPDERLTEGISAILQVALATEDELELVVRRIPVSFATTPNLNPAVGKITADGEALVEPLLVVKPGHKVVWTAAVEGGPETYEYITAEGWLELRTEKLEWRWYTDIGRLDGGGPLDLPGEEPQKDIGTARWTAPRKPGEGFVHAVVLDGRGGMGWASVRVRVH